MCHNVTRDRTRQRRASADEDRAREMPDPDRRGRMVEDGLNRATISDGVPIAPVDTIVLMKLLAGRTQDLADIEAIIASGADRDVLRDRVHRALPTRLGTIERLFERRPGALSTPRDQRPRKRSSRTHPDTHVFDSELVESRDWRDTLKP
jgi:hypothetical protein